MARVISADKCVACGSCIAECPVEAINEGDVYTIDADACIDCGACEATCPFDAINQDSSGDDYDNSAAIGSSSSCNHIYGKDQPKYGK